MMNSTQMQLVRNIAGSSISSLARSNACAILFFVFHEDCGFDIGASSQRINNAPSPLGGEQERGFFSFLGESYPNPATNKVYIPYNLPEENGGIMNIYDVNGKVLASFILMQGENILEVNTINLPSGVYAYNITIDGTQMETRRMVIINNK